MFKGVESASVVDLLWDAPNFFSCGPASDMVYSVLLKLVLGVTRKQNVNAGGDA